MKLSELDQVTFSNQLARQATLDIGDAMGGLPVRVENEIEETLGNAFQHVLGLLEVTRDGDVQLLTKEGPRVLSHPEASVTH